MIKNFFVLSLLLILAVGCSKVPVGFLKTEDASYKPSKVYAYHQVEDETPWSKGAPFSSTEIQGLAGTPPISYEFLSVRAADGADEAKFLEAVRSGGFQLRGSYIQLFPQAAKTLPYGSYTISLRIFNEDHSATLTDVFTFVVKEAWEEGDDELQNY